jgi:hypothetical protein
MALGLNIGPAVYPSVGAGALALVDNYADLRMQRVIPQLDNGVALNLAVLLADIFNVVPDGTRAGDILDGARDGAVFGLVQSATTGHLLSAVSVAPAAVAPATPVAAAQAAGNASTLTSAIPAANASAVMDTQSAGY